MGYELVLNCRAKKLGPITVVIMMAVGFGTAVRSTKGCFPNATKRMRRVAFCFVLFLTSLEILKEFGEILYENNVAHYGSWR